MAAFPTFVSVPCEASIRHRMHFRVLESEFDNDVESRKLKSLYPRRDLTISYDQLTLAQARTLWQFYQARHGRFEAFSFFYPDSDTYAGEYVGTGDGSTLVFNLPSMLASSYTVYIDSIAQTAGSNYTFTSQGGADGADKVEFTTAPSIGQRITFSFTGYLKVRSRFAESYLDFEIFYNRLVTMGVGLKGFLNA